jgi:hypothetical protein
MELHFLYGIVLFVLFFPLYYFIRKFFGETQGAAVDFDFGASFKYYIFFVLTIIITLIYITIFICFDNNIVDIFGKYKLIP